MALPHHLRLARKRESVGRFCYIHTIVDARAVCNSTFSAIMISPPLINLPVERRKYDRAFYSAGYSTHEPKMVCQVIESVSQKVRRRDGQRVSVGSTSLRGGPCSAVG